MSVWLSTTLIQALRQLIDLFSFYFNEINFLLEEILDILVICITQESETLSKLGSMSLHELVEARWLSNFTFGLSFINSSILLITSYWSAFIMYLTCVGLLSLYMIYIAHATIEIKPEITVACLLAVFFTVLQGIALRIVHNMYRVRLQCAIWVTFVANSIAAVTTYLLTVYMHQAHVGILSSIKNFF
jgi:hypothetical protein